MKRALPYLIVTGLAVALAVAQSKKATVATEMDEQAIPKGLPDAPAFTLADPNGIEHSLADFRGKYVVLEWLNHGCPFVKKFYDGGNMQKWQKHYTDQDVVWLSICSSAPGKQGYHPPERWNSVIAEKNMKSTAVLIDESGEVGRAYQATNTPHMYVINPDGKLIYQGAIDSIRSANSSDIEEATNYVTTLLDAVLRDKTKAYGCSIKY